jgi:UDP-N-acetylmuramoyl-tripeptide--D-alanyl-D-alanine ligase
MDTDIIIKGISDYTPTNHRSQLIHVGKLQIIMDSYNANPSSMEAAITNLAGKNTPFKIAVLGDMFELGIYAQEEHQKIADFAQKYALDEIHLIGSNFNRTVTTNAIKHENFEAFAASFKHPKETKTTVLIKGSRGMALERVLKLL